MASKKNPTSSPVIEVGETRPDPSFLISQLDKVQREEIEKELRRKNAQKEIAKHRWQIAQHIHLLEDGISKLDFNSRPFQRGIYQDDGLDTVIYGATQFGKPQTRESRVRIKGAWTTMGQIVVGDVVDTPDGQGARVTGVFPRGLLPVYRLTTADGRSCEAADEHLWEVRPEGYEVGTTTTAVLKSAMDSAEHMKFWIPVVNRSGKETEQRVKSIEYVGEKDCICIAIDHPRRLYITDDGICSHNTEYLIVDMATTAMYGFKVMVVMPNKPKKDKFVGGRVDTCFGTVPTYKDAIAVAAARSARVDNTQMKSFGPGSIIFVSATVDGDFTSHPADKVIVDEYQECDHNNVQLISTRMSGSWFGGMLRMGHPTIAGTATNLNLDWYYQNSDQRAWKIPCDSCNKYQQLTWHGHVVKEDRGKGGVTSMRPYDEEWRPGSKFDIRPICEECKRPMNRLHQEGIWEPQNPGHARHGYQLSNLYNGSPICRLDLAFEQYSAARFSATAMQEFHNKYLGTTFDMDGSKFNESVLNACANGAGTGVIPYRFQHAAQIAWNRKTA